MCGIVGLFLKDESMGAELGAHLTGMLTTMSDRGPDSAGIAVYREAGGGMAKVTVQSPNPDADFPALAADLGAAIGAAVSAERNDTHMILTLPEAKPARPRGAEIPAARGAGDVRWRGN